MDRRTLLAATAAAVAAAGSAQAAATPPITDPGAFVASVYKRMAASESYAPPTDFYTARFNALWAQEKRETPKGDVGFIDFEFWSNAQEWAIKDVKVKTLDVEARPYRKVVIANFLNGDRPEEIRFYFERSGGRWLLDDVRCMGEETWTLSLILKYGWDQA